MASMDQGPDNVKRPRLSSGVPTWAGTSQHRAQLPNPTPAPQAPNHPTPPVYQPSHPFSRPSEPPPPPAATAHHHYDDRRHHDPEHFPPMQEHRQPPPSPVHPSYPPYHHRDPLVKRDPADEPSPSLAHMRRPHSSTGNASDGLPATPHAQLPPQPHLEDRRHMSFDGGPPPPPPPPPGPMYRAPSYPPPTPLPQPQHYEHSMYGPPQGAESIYPISYSTTGKRKAQRASQACDSCRSLKAKCDETKPCKNCREKNLECKYRDPVPKQQDKVAADILDGINLLRSELTSGLSRFDHRMTKLERALKQINPAVDLDPEPPGLEPPRSYHHAISPAPPHADDVYSSPEDIAMSNEPQPPPPPPVAEPIVSINEARRTVNQMYDDDELEVVPGPPVAPGEPAMPINHTTLAGLLLSWGPIKERVNHLLDQEGIRYTSEYPIRQEEQRGLLRIFGRGEGHDRRPVEGKDTPGDIGTIGGPYVESSADDVSDVISSPSPGDWWGQTGGLSPPSSVELKGTPLRANGDLNLDSEVVWQYVASFEQNILNMHPLIIPKELRAMVKVFLERIPQSNKQSKRVGTAGFVAQTPTVPEMPAESSLKRKRSPATDVSDPVTQPQKPGKPFRNVDTAVILLVLALGKICKEKDSKLPDIVPESENIVHQSPQLRNGHPPSPSQGSPPSYSTQSQSSGLPSPKVDERNLPSRRQSFQGHNPTTAKTSYTLKRNLDSIPGLEYFAIATDIIGNHIGGKELKHVWVSLLAGLYFGQLGRPLQSLEHIAMAGRILQSILRPHLSEYGKLKETLQPLSQKRQNLHAFAFWTCLQLESDILAELQLPPSGILAYEQQMPYPNHQLAVEHGFSEEVLQSYTAQLYLRNHLNQIHKSLYDPRDFRSIQPYSYDGTRTVDILFESLDISRWVPDLFRFKETDPPAGDILAARLRAKYWGARSITYRPFVKMIVEFHHAKKHHPSGAAPFIPTHGDYRSELTVPHIHPEAQSSQDIPKQVIEYARRGVNALIESTRAFHGVTDRRFIVTNVFGTAHAQWGNLLILDSVRRDPILGTGLDDRMLRELFDRTIEFFEVVAQPTSSLTHDMNILKGLRREWDQERAGMDRAGSSFSSATTGPPVVTHGLPLPNMHAPATPNESHYGGPNHMQHMSYSGDMRRQSGEP